MADNDIGVAFGPSTLCVMVRGWVSRNDRPRVLLNDDGGEFPCAFREFVGQVLPHADIITPNLDMGLYSTATPEELVEELLSAIDEAFNAERHANVLIVAYSSGGPLARFALTVAFGVDEYGRFSGERRAWAADNVSVRIVYLAGTLHGWSVTTATPAYQRFMQPVLELIVRTVCGIKSWRVPFIAHLRRNEPFIIQGRLRQLALRDASGETGLPWEQVSFLGTQDEFISPNDCVELVHRSRSIFVETPSTNHIEMLRVDESDTAKDPEKRQLIKTRRKLLTRGLTEAFETLVAEEGFAIHDDDINDYFDSLDRPRDLEQHSENVPNHAVIILHGIRDNGFWTKRVARQLKETSTRPLMRAPSPTYGFFSMLDFVWKPARTKQTKWLLGQYADIRECYPGAKISFVGHSNGTYLAKRAMELCPAVNFERIFFGGSVIRTDHDWLALRPQVRKAVLNLMGSNDTVIALLPGAMERLKIFRFLDVGGAGFFGFEQATTAGGWIKNWIYRGGHSDAVAEGNWSIISEFISKGTFPEGLGSERTESENRLGRNAPIITLLMLLSGFGSVGVLTFLISSQSSVLATLFLMFSAWFVWRILRAF